MPRALARLKYPINYPHDVAKLRLEYDTPSPVTVDVDAIRRFEEGRIIYETPLIDYHSYLKLVQPIVRDGLVAEWLFFEGAGDVLHDTSGQGNHGTIYGSTWQKLDTGKWVLYHDGVDDYEEVPYSTSLNVSASFTLETLVKTDVGGHEGVIGITSDGRYAYFDGFFIRKHAGESRYRYCVNIDGTRYPITGSYIIDGAWHHLIFTFDGATVAIYEDGILRVTKSIAGSVVIPTRPLRIGLLPYLSYFVGYIALARLYNRSLTEDEISELYELAKLIVPLG